MPRRPSQSSPRTAIALLLLALLPAAAPTTFAQSPEAAPGDGFQPGIADPEDTGTFPPHATELAKKAAHAISKRDWKTARKAYRDILASAPQNALALANLGAVEYQMGDLKNAQAHLEAAVARRPALTSSWTTLGLIHYQQGDLHLATAALSRAIHADPKNAQAHNYLAVVAKSRGWTTAAELELQKALDLKPDYAEAHFNLALVYLDRRPPATELARRHYYRAKDLGALPDPLVEEQLAGKKPAQ